MKKVAGCFFIVLMTGLLMGLIPTGIAIAADNPLLRQTTAGTIEGFADNTAKAWIWKSVPYAKPPVGPLRWKAPQDLAPWEGVRSAKEKPQACMQNAVLPTWVQLPEANGSEDCLYMNIFRPQTEEKNLPVYMWIHGGANYWGYAELYALENLAVRANMVVVVVQYRLNAFGYFTHPSLRLGKTPVDASGNYGTLDQIQALKWIKHNIASFGGNPYNVTVGGESAGGHNTTAMLISPLARGLFHRAVMESGGMKSQSVAATDAIADRTIDIALVMKGKAKDAAEASVVRKSMTGAGIAAFMGGLTGEEVLRAVSGGPGQAAPPLANLIEDGYVIPGNLLCTIESGNYNKVPIMAGANEFESGSIHTLLPGLFEGMANYMDLLEVVAGKKKLDEVLPKPMDKLLYSKAKYYGSRFWRAAMSDELARRLRDHQDDVYIYSFNWGEEDVRPDGIGFIYGASHALEIPFFQANVDQNSRPEMTDLVFKGFTDTNKPGRIALSKAMVSYFGQFARTGNPNKAGTGLTVWDAWSNLGGGPKAIILDADNINTKISMDNEEVSMTSVRFALEKEDPGVVGFVKLITSIMEPYSAYNTGYYEYNQCK